MLDLECFGMKAHDAPCSFAELSAAAVIDFNHFFRATMLTDADLDHRGKTIVKSSEQRSRRGHSEFCTPTHGLLIFE